MVNKIQFVFCQHTHGHLSHKEEIQAQPPLGILTLASYLKQAFPQINIEAYDGKFFRERELLDKLDADIIGFSTWFSNYEVSLSLAKKIKASQPETTIIFGGPHATAMPKKILMNNEWVDYVICGEGELPFTQLLLGNNVQKISGVFSRDQNKVVGSNDWQTIDLNLLRFLNLDLLLPSYKWLSGQKSPAMSAFPLSGIRGCMRGGNRCEYCSIPTQGYRWVSPRNYWKQVEQLNQQYGIDFFFETGDTFPRRYLRELGSFPDHPDVAFRIYSYPSSFNYEDIPYLTAMGVRTIFMGIESVLHWNRKFKRKYPSNYSIDSLLEEIKMYGEVGIDVIPGFLLGLPGENYDSLSQNLKLIDRISQLDNVHEITVSIILPLPGADYFDWCCQDNHILSEYENSTGDNLIIADKIDYYLLSRLFVERFTQVKYEHLYDAIQGVRKRQGTGMANWGMKSLVEDI